MYTSKEKLLEDLREYNAKGVCKVLPKECSKELLSDKDIVFEMIKCGYEGRPDSDFLEYASDEIKSDKQFVLKALKLDLGAYRFIDDKLKSDEEIVSLAVKYFDFFRYAPKKFRSDKNIIFEYIMEEGCLAPEFVEYVDTTIFAEDRGFVLKCLTRTGGQILRYYNIKETEEDNKLVFDTLSKFGEVMEFLPERFKNDRELIKKLCAENRNGFFQKYIQYVDESVLRDREFIKELVEINYMVYRSLPTDLMEDKEIALIAIRGNNWNNFKTPYNPTYACLPDSLLTDREIILEACKNNHRSRDYIPEEILTDSAFVKELDDACSIAREELFKVSEKREQGDIANVEEGKTVSQESGENLEFKKVKDKTKRKGLMKKIMELFKRKKDNTNNDDLENGTGVGV